MSYASLSLSVTVPAYALDRAREILETAVDEMVKQWIEVYDIRVSTNCADQPSSHNQQEIKQNE